MRQALAGLAAVLVLGAAVFAVLRAVEVREEEADAQAEAVAEAPEATIDAYLAAWETGDHAAMAALVRDTPGDFTTYHEQLRQGLGVDRLTIERTGLVEDVDGRATGTAAVVAQLPTLGELTWDVEVRLLRERGIWGIAWDPAALHPEWRPGLRFVTTTVATDRAPLLARDGTQIAGPGQRITFGLEPGAVDSPDEVIDAFEAAVAGSGDTVARLLARGDLVDGWFYPVVSVSEEQARDARGPLTGVPGVIRRTEDGARNLLTDDFAVHVLGRTGEATAEELEELGPPYKPGDTVGRFGLEAALETRLAEDEEVRLELRDGVDGPVRATLATGSTDGDTDVGPVTTTLDVAVQRAVENALVGSDRAAAFVVVDGGDGAIRAAASRPLDGFNRAFEGRYPPGTAFAPVVVEALVAAGTDPTAEVACPAEAIHAGRQLQNVGGLELNPGPATDAVTAGCATTLGGFGVELGGEALVEAARRFGAGTEPALPLFANGLSFPDPIDLGEAAVAAAGQGRVEVSALHLATVAAATATGRWSPSHLLEEDGPGTASPLTPSPLTPGALDGLQRLLAPVDEAGGLAGFPATARGQDGAIHSWFVGTVDGMGVAVLVEAAGEDPADGAGPLAARFARELTALTAEPAEPAAGESGT